MRVQLTRQTRHAPFLLPSTRHLSRNNTCLFNRRPELRLTMSTHKRSKSSVGTDYQMKTRKERHFAETEAGLPSITQNTAFKLPGIVTSKLSIPSKVGDILSYLGPYNPHPQQIAAGDAVWLFDNVAFRNPKGKWEAEFVAAVLSQDPSCKVPDVVSQVAQMVGLSKDAQETATIARRITPFLMDIQPGRVVNASLGSGTQLKLGPGGRNGISSDIKQLPSGKAGDLVTTTAQVPAGANGVLEMKTIYSEPDGWAVISDIDDTIKITMTSDPIGILRSTFISTPTPVDGMPELYAHIHKLLGPQSPFFYLSASPYNLYPFLRNFREQYYPFGQLILRDASWMTIPGLLSNLTLGTEAYKVDRMEKIHSWLPKKKIICIGDSTQSDPEAFGDIYRTFPGWVKVILIRKVTDIASVGIETKNAPERFEKAFDGVPRDIWHVFEDPAECYNIIGGAVA